MRLILRLEPMGNFSEDEIHSHQIQGLIYSTLQETEIDFLHNRRLPKFLSFSNFFPLGPFKEGESKSIIIASPIRHFVDVLKERLEGSTIFLGKYAFKVLECKKFSPRISGNWITATPVIVRRSPKSDDYMSTSKGDSELGILKRIEENAIWKHKIFFNETPNLRRPIFARATLKKEVAVKVWLSSGRPHVFVGSLWELTVRRNLFRNRKFLSLIVDAGLGSFNSMGFGFVNTIIT